MSNPDVTVDTIEMESGGAVITGAEFEISISVTADSHEMSPSKTSSPGPDAGGKLKQLDLHTVRFVDGEKEPWGYCVNFDDHWSEWKITKMLKTQQAHRRGVEMGWRIRRVNNLEVSEYTFKEVKRILERGPECTITFETVINEKRCLTYPDIQDALEHASTTELQWSIFRKIKLAVLCFSIVTNISFLSYLFWVKSDSEPKFVQLLYLLENIGLWLCLFYLLAFIFNFIYEEDKQPGVVKIFIFRISSISLFQIIQYYNITRIKDHVVRRYNQFISLSHKHKVEDNIVSKVCLIWAFVLLVAVLLFLFFFGGLLGFTVKMYQIAQVFPENASEARSLWDLLQDMKTSELITFLGICYQLGVMFDPSSVRIEQLMKSRFSGSDGVYQVKEYDASLNFKEALEGVFLYRGVVDFAWYLTMSPEDYNTILHAGRDDVEETEDVEDV